MRTPVEIENIEQMRLQAGIDDVELRQEIRGLRIGDLVKLTLLTDAKSCVGETVFVRITSIKGHEFRGKLAQRPTSAGRSKLPVGLSVAFSTVHIHSLPKDKPPHGQ